MTGRSMVSTSNPGSRCSTAHKSAAVNAKAKDPALRQAYPFDQAKAKAMLGEAGWQPGADGVRTKGGQRLEIVLNAIEYGGGTDPTAQLIQSLLNWGLGGAAAFILLSVTLAIYALQLRYFNGSAVVPGGR